MKNTTVKATTSLLVALSAALGACVTPDPDPGFTPAWEQFDPEGKGWQSTREALLISDCQLHNLYSKPVPDRNLSAKAAIQTAIRSPQLDLYAEDVLRWILENESGEVDVVLHLGDALDLACEGEFARFERVMSAAQRPWFMTPGNHDAYYFGNYQPQNPDLWQDACYRAGRPLTKDLYIRLYVAMLLRQSELGIDSLAGALGLQDSRGEPSAELAERLPLEFEWHAPADSGGLLSAIAWSIDEERPWRSFIIQEVDLGKDGQQELQHRVLLLDSCQYSRRPEMVPNGWMSYPVHLNSGSTGEMLPDQLRLVRSWLENSPAASNSFACHHPFTALSPRARVSLGWLWREHSIATLISGHTHEGYYKHHDLGEGIERLELNIASTTDWPMEWRTLVGFVNRQDTQAYIRSERQTLAKALAHREGYFLPGWEIPLGAPDDYRKYKRGISESKMFLDYYIVFHLTPYWLPQPELWVGRGARQTETSIKDALLLTHRRLLRVFPTAPNLEGLVWPDGCTSDSEVQDLIEVVHASDDFDRKVDLLVQLGRWERERSSADPRTEASTDEERHRYKVCQAAWASRYEKEQGRRLSVEDELIRLTRRLDERGARP